MKHGAFRLEIREHKALDARAGFVHLLGYAKNDRHQLFLFYRLAKKSSWIEYVL